MQKVYRRNISLILQTCTHFLLRKKFNLSPLRVVTILISAHKNPKDAKILQLPCFGEKRIFIA